jgi:amidase
VLAYGYDFEQATKARVLPKHTPALPSDVLGMAAARNTP